VPELYRGQRICVVIPCYSLEAHISDVLSAMPDYVDHVIAVDDGSRTACGSRQSLLGPRIVT